MDKPPCGSSLTLRQREAVPSLRDGHGLRDQRIVGMTKSAPARMPVGQRLVMVLSFV